MHEVWGALAGQRRWLEGRSRRLATQLGVRADADDISQAVILRFVERAAAGWFDQQPKVSFEAQVRHLIAQCLRQEMTDRLRLGKREFLPPRELEQREVDSRLGSHGGEGESHERLDIERRREWLRQAVFDELNPGRRLYLVALLYPHSLAREHIEQAGAFRVGGAQAVCRPVGECWALYREALAHTELVGDDLRWKRTIAEVFRLRGPLGTATQAELDRAVNYIDVQHTRALRELGSALAPSGGSDEL